MTTPLTLASFMDGHAVPGDLTLAEVGAYMMTLPELRAVAAMTRTGRVAVHFLMLPDRVEFDDATTMDVFRHRVEIGLASISIDDGSGGLRVMEDA